MAISNDRISNEIPPDSSSSHSLGGSIFAELDQEIEEYERGLFAKPVATSPNDHKPLLKKLFHMIRTKWLERPMTHVITSDASMEANHTVVVCRICENTIHSTTLEGHTEWCSKYHDYLLKKERCLKYLKVLQEQIVNARPSCHPLIELCSKALLIDEEQGKNASIRLAKLFYRLTKFSSDMDLNAHNQALLKRLKYLMEQKRILADHFSELRPSSSWISPTTEISSVTDSSLETTPQRSSTPVAKLTTLLSSLVLKRNRNTSKSPHLTSSPSGLRAIQKTMPQIIDFEILKPISRGGCGSIYLAKKKKTSDLYAIKALRKSDLIKKNMASHVLTERRLMSLAQAPFIVRLFYAFESEEYLFLVMEYLIGGDLSSRIQSYGAFSEDEARFYMAELVQSLDYLHENGIIHRDIKPDNMLLDAEGHLKLTDFGLAGLQWKHQCGGVLGTPEYIAPEVIRGEDYGTAVDWWAAGVSLFEFLIGVPPFNGTTPEQIFHSILSHRCVNWPAYEHDNISPIAKDLIDRLLDPNPNTRLGSQGTKYHPYFTGMDWPTLRSQVAPIKPDATDPLDTSSFAARNLRYSDIDLPASFKEAEPLHASHGHSSTDEMTSGSGFSTPGRFANSATLRASASPFDGFDFKNVELLGQVNRKLSSTPSMVHTSKAISRVPSGALSDGGL